jgi:hypothetical protein
VLWAWGNNYQGSAGVNSTSALNAPRIIGVQKTWQDIGGI